MMPKKQAALSAMVQMAMEVSVVDVPGWYTPVRSRHFIVSPVFHAAAADLWLRMEGRPWMAA